MTEWLDWLLARLVEAPEPVIHLVLGLAAALENLVPPIPADVVILFGGFLAGKGATPVWAAFLVVWTCNVAGALLMYAVGKRYGANFFASRWGRLILRPDQLGSLHDFYGRYGFRVIFFSRFLPMFRAVVPVFAGVSRLGFFRTAIPIAAASGIWYGALVYLGAAAGENWEEILATIQLLGRGFYAVAVLLAAAVVWWWWRGRSDASRI